MPNRDELKEKICLLILEEKKTPNEIKTELNIPTTTYYYYVNKLKKEGRIPEDFTFRRTVSKKEKEIIRSLLLEQGMTMGQICNEIKISGDKLRETMNEMKKEGLLAQDFSSLSNLSTEQKEIVRYLALEQKQTQKEIAKTLGVGVNTMVKYVKQLKKEGILPKDFVFRKGGIPLRKGPLTEERKENIRVMVLEKNYMAIEVAEALGVSLPTLTKYMLQLKEEGIIPQEFSFANRNKK